MNGESGPIGPPPAKRRLGRRAWLLLALKLAVSAGGLFLTFRIVDLADLKSVSIPWGLWLPAMLALFFLQAALMAVRQWALLRLMGERFPYGTCLKAYLVGLFCGQVLVTFVAGDLVKIWYLGRGRSKLVPSVATILDRIYGFLGIITLAIPAGLLIATYGWGDPAAIPWRAIAAAFIGAMIAATVLLRLLASGGSVLARAAMPDRLKELGRSFGVGFSRVGSVAVLLGLSVVTQAINLVILALIGDAMGSALTAKHYLLLTPVPLLLSHLPISFAGWGVREGAMTLAFGHTAGSPEFAAAMSIVFGLGLLASSLPGLVLLLTLRYGRSSRAGRRSER